jgi:hypothetical protein
MEIHRPKSLHNWRDFAKEVGVIVLGVCIALAGEQGVEWLHWRHQIADARQALRREVAYNLGAVAKRREEGPCINRRLAEIRVLLTDAAAGGAPTRRASLGQPQLWRPRSNVWQAAMAGQVAEHMPLDMRLSYAELYDGFQWYAQKVADESDAWSVLGELDDPGRLGSEDLAAVRQARSRAQVAADKLDAYLPRIIAAGARSGIKPAVVEATKPTTDAIDALCRPLR